MKTLLTLIIIILLVVAAGCYYVNKHSTAFVNDYLTKQLNTPVKVGSVSVGFREIVLEGISVTDPSSPRANIITIKRISVGYELMSLLSKTIRINNIIIDHPLAYIKANNVSGSDNNWKSFLDKQSKGRAPSSNEAKEKEERTVLVNKLVINYLSADLNHPVLGKVHLPVRKQIVINNIDTGNPLRTEQQLSVIIEAIMQALSQYKGLGALVDGIVALPFNIASNITGQLAGQAGDIASGVAEGAAGVVQEGLENIKDFFGNLFQKAS